MSKILQTLLLSLFALFIGCQKLELPTQNDDKTSEDKKENTITPDDSTDYYTVATLSQAADEDFVTLKCYIVGYMPNNTIKSAVFSADEAVETNLVVADKPSETDYTQCASIQLKKGTDAREQLNLCDNPDLLHTHLLLLGTKSEYCYTTGLTNIKAFEIIESDGEEDDDNNDGDASTPSNAFPTLSNEESDVFEGA